TLLWGRQGSRSPSPAYDAVWCAGRPAWLVYASMSHWRVGLHGMARPQAGGGLVSPNPRALRPAAPPPHLWSAPLGPQYRACAGAPSVSPWRGAWATGPPLPRGVPPRGAGHSPLRAPAPRAGGGGPPGARAPRRGAP